jgi:hypothetical protein
MPLLHGRDIPFEADLNSPGYGAIRGGLKKYFPEEHIKIFNGIAGPRTLILDRTVLRELTALRIKESGDGEFGRYYSPSLANTLKRLSEKPSYVFLEKKPPETKKESTAASSARGKAESSPSAAADNVKTRMKRMIKRRLSSGSIAQYVPDHFAYIFNAAGR